MPKGTIFVVDAGTRTNLLHPMSRDGGTLYVPMLLINPASDQPIRELAEDSVESIKDKASRARRAQRAWAERPFAERLAAIQRFRDLIVEHTPELAKTLTTETGKPISQSSNELKSLLDRLDFFIEHTGRELEPETVLGSAGEALEERIVHEPLGVIANVSAWNYPYFVGSNVFIPALLTGNAVLYKPSEFSTLTGLEIAKLLYRAGVPEDVFIPIVGGGKAGATLLEQRVNGVFFTGSYATGQKIASAVAPRMIKFQLELGGKDPVYVAPDVDVESVAPGVADGAFYNTGQSCCAVERIYVHEKIFDAFVDRFVAEVKGFVIGDPLDPKTYIGPLARRQAQIDELERQTRDALDKGAKLLTGGKRADRPGNYFEPTVLVDVTHQMSVMRDESFGPIIGLMKVKSDAEAIELMQDTDYGLTAAVYTKERATAEKVLAQLDVGSAYWNCCDRVSPRLPWSGRGHSGVGCTLSTYGIEAFTQPKAWHLRKS